MGWWLKHRFAHVMSVPPQRMQKVAPWEGWSTLGAPHRFEVFPSTFTRSRVFTGFDELYGCRGLWGCTTIFFYVSEGRIHQLQIPTPWHLQVWASPCALLRYCSVGGAVAGCCAIALGVRTSQTSEKSKMLKGGWESFKLQPWLRNTSNRVFLGAQGSTNVERSCKSMQIWLENVRSFQLTYHECMIMMIMHAHVPLPYMSP